MEDNNKIIQNEPEKPKIKIKDEKFVKKHFTDIEKYILSSIVDNDRPKLENCLIYKDSYDLKKCVNSKGTTFLHYAASGKDILNVMVKANNIISCLINNGADPYATDVDGLTPLDYAEIKGNKNIMEAIRFHAKVKKEK